MTKYLNLQNWKRKDQFYFFKNYDNPFFNLCTELDVTTLYRYVKEKDISFFKAYIFLSLKTANKMESFRYRIRGDKVIVHDIIHAGSTVLNEDETFSFCYFDYIPDFQQFETNVKKALKENQKKGSKLDAHDDRDDRINYSIIPWISFTSFSNPRMFKNQDSTPIIVFGNYYKVNDLIKMPVSIEVHHALMDGIHVAKFLDLFQHYLNNVESMK